MPQPKGGTLPSQIPGKAKPFEGVHQPQLLHTRAVRGKGHGVREIWPMIAPHLVWVSLYRVMVESGTCRQTLHAAKPHLAKRPGLQTTLVGHVTIPAIGVRSSFSTQCTLARLNRLQLVQPCSRNVINICAPTLKFHLLTNRVTYIHIFTQGASFWRGQKHAHRHAHDVF